MAVAALLAGCGSVPVAPLSESAPGPFGTRPRAVEPVSRLSPEQARDATVHALGLVGTPYRWGGNTPDSGFDCSGLIGYVYRSAAGLAPPRSTTELQGWGAPVDPATLRTGDLVLFGARGQVSHAGIFVGQERFVHAPSSGGQVRLERLNAPYWSQRLLAARRP